MIDVYANAHSPGHAPVIPGCRKFFNDLSLPAPDWSTSRSGGLAAACTASLALGDPCIRASRGRNDNAAFLRSPNAGLLQARKREP